MAGYACAFALASCGGSATSGTATSQPSASAVSVAAARAAPSKPPSRALLLEVNDVCRAVRQGAPLPPRPPYTTVSVSRYARAALPPTRRTIVSLQRLAARGDGRALLTIADGYAQLEAVYNAAGLLGGNEQAARQLVATAQAREQAVTAAAVSAGFPACGVAGR